MVADGLLTRQRYREVPPRVDYELTERSKGLLPVLGALARWGYEWTWTAPREDEHVDVGALFRLLPGLLVPPAGARGLVELTVHLPDGTPRPYAVRVARDAVTLTERPTDEADAQVVGAEREWIEALGPDAERGGLEITGDERLAGLVLDGLVVAQRAEQVA